MIAMETEQKQHIKFELWGNIPDMSHVREWVLIAQADTLKELRAKKEKYMSRWQNTSNYFRLRESGSFKVVDGESGNVVERDF